jgi:hypothetical protein
MRNVFSLRDCLRCVCLQAPAADEVAIALDKFQVGGPLHAFVISCHTLDVMHAVAQPIRTAVRIPVNATPQRVERVLNRLLPRQPQHASTSLGTPLPVARQFGRVGGLCLLFCRTGHMT